MRASNTDNRGILWAVWAAFTAVIAFVAARHEPWFDEYHVWFMCHELDISGLLSEMPEEGHFVLWHLLIYPFVKLGVFFWCLQLVSVCVVSVGAWFLLMKAPFDTLSKCLVLFSYPMLYEFPVIARCYALIPVILFVIAWLYQSQERHMYLYCFFVGLLAHTHAYMEGMVGALFLLFCYERIYLPRKEGKDTRRAIKAASLTVFVVLLAFLQVAGWLLFAVDHPTATDASTLDTPYSLLVYLLSPAFPVINAGKWQDRLPESLQFIDVATVLIVVFSIVWLVICYALYHILIKPRKNRRFAVVGLIAIGWEAFMALDIFFIRYQRVYLHVLIIICLLWLAYSQELRKQVRIALAGLLLVTAGYIKIAWDVRGIFCDDLKLYTYVNERIDKGNSLYFTSYDHRLVLEQLFTDDYDLRLKETVNTQLHSPDSLTDEVLRQAFKECKNKKSIYLFADKRYQPQVKDYEVRYQSMTVLADTIYYYLYQVDRK